MSPRAACRLMQLGFAPVYDYTLPTVRAAQPSRRVLDAVRRDVPTCAPGAPAGLAMQQARAQGWDRCMVIAGQAVERHRSDASAGPGWFVRARRLLVLD